jgi:hypothetical protein
MFTNPGNSGEKLSILISGTFSTNIGETTISSFRQSISLIYSSYKCSILVTEKAKGKGVN